MLIRFGVSLRLAVVGAVALVAVAAGLARAEEPVRPKLVVVVSVDQLCYDYLERFHENFNDDGFFRLCEREGVWLSECHHRHAFTLTGPGHAVQLTGCYPSEHGIVGNDWYDREQRKTVYCAADPQATLIGTTIDDTRASPRNLVADTLGDRLKIATGGKAKVFGVAIKDRASILMTGHSADAAYWMSNDGKWITSDYYRNDLPGYLREINEGGAVARFGGTTWDRLLPAERYLHGVEEDSFGERPYARQEADFPHPIVAAGEKDYIKQVAGSPFGNDLTIEAAAAVLLAEELGLNDTPDLLCINFSSNDYVGHAFGPHSLEVEDMVYRTDRQLRELVRVVDERLGDRPWIMALTADHAVAPVPERMQRQKVPASRDPFGKAMNGNYEAISQPLEALLRGALTVADDAPPLVQIVRGHEVFLAADHPALRGDRFVEAQRLARDFVLKHPAVVSAVAREQMLSGGATTRLEQMFRRSFHSDRSGDVLFALRPYHFHGDAAATHGSPWEYDTHVPLLLLPRGFREEQSPLRPGRYSRNVSPAQLAPTLARVLGIPAPAMCVEEAIEEVLATR
jgi:hypothetical protein